MYGRYEIQKALALISISRYISGYARIMFGAKDTDNLTYRLSRSLKNYISCKKQTVFNFVVVVCDDFSEDMRSQKEKKTTTAQPFSLSCPHMFTVLSQVFFF